MPEIYSGAWGLFLSAFISSTIAPGDKLLLLFQVNASKPHSFEGDRGSCLVETGRELTHGHGGARGW